MLNFVSNQTSKEAKRITKKKKEDVKDEEEEEEEDERKKKKQNRKPKKDKMRIYLFLLTIKLCCK